MPEYSARFTSSAESLRRARDAVRVFATACGFGEADVGDIVCAAGEAIANAVEHGGAPGVFTLACEYAENALTIEIADSGRGFTEWHEVQAKRSGASPDAMPSINAPLRGYGIKIMYEMMDDVSYHDGGRRVRLTKRSPRIETHNAEGTGTERR